MTSTLSRPRLRLPGLIGALATVHFVSRAGGFAQTFLVLYLTQDRQLSPATAGAVAAAVGAGTAGSLLLGGWLSDRIGRRHTMLAGFLGTAFALVALGSADTLPAIVASAVGVGLVSELARPAGTASVADLPGARERMRAFGLLFWATNLGFSVSAIMGGVLVRYGYGLLFWLNAAASAGAALVVWLRVPETRPAASGASRRALLPVVLHDRLLITTALIFVAYFSLFFQAFSTLPLAMTADGLPSAMYGTILAVNGVVILIAQPLAVRLLAGRDKYVVLGASMLLVGLGFGLGAVVHGGVGYAGAVLVWTAGEVGIAVMFGAIFADLAPADLRGGYMGIAATTWGVGGALGPLLGTAVLERAGATALWLGCAAVGVALFAVLRAAAPALRVRASVRGGDL
ncbi:MFS transporter [Pseudonocardia acaciae]|uniref:MFS transporter n=1 Tax=Pseudonocardia acaciae TaxID=551276 RepID=UPI00056A8F3E|nr:MFS transporter [Pseudonocardia acaciae]